MRAAVSMASLLLFLHDITAQEIQIIDKRIVNFIISFQWAGLFSNLNSESPVNINRISCSIILKETHSAIMNFNLTCGFPRPNFNAT